MKRCIAILLALLILTACAAGGQAPVQEPESEPSSVSEPASASASSEPEPDPMPDLRPGRVLSFQDIQGLTPDYPVKTVKGTQAELDRWKAAVRDPAIARMDFTDMRQETAQLPVEQEQEILTAMREAEIRLYEGNPDPSTGGGCSVTVYDGEENMLFDMAYVGDFFSVWFAGEGVVYYFDGEGTTLDKLLTSDYGVPAEPVSAPEPDHTGDPDWRPANGEDPITGPPDMGSQENPDTSVMYTDEENAAWQREFAFVDEINAAFSQSLPKECYSYWSAYGEGTGNDMKLVLEVGVTDETVLDAYLSAWTGTKWDKLVKKPGRASQAKQEEFAERANKLDLGPNAYLEVRPDGGSTNTEYGKILVSVGNKDWREAEQAVKDLAKEMGIPEDMLSYLEPRPNGSVNPDGTVTNPDT